MKTYTSMGIASLAWVCLATATGLAAANVEEQVIAPYNADGKYCVSHRGVHAAGVVRKGSRLNVYVDGAPGPKIEEVVTAAATWIDPRPFQNDTWMRSYGYPVDQITERPVVFSRNGQRYAYLARNGQEWILYSDGKEVMRVPVGGVEGSSGQSDLRIEFSGDDGKHLLMSVGGYPGSTLWVDGTKWPGFFGSGGGGSEGTIDPVYSPDGEHIAYVAQIDRDKRTVILDGKDTGYFGYDLHFSPDGKHLISRVDGPKGTAVLVDGKPLFTARQILAFYMAPVGNRIATVLNHEYPDHSQGQFVLLNGKPLEPTLCKGGVKKVVFSPDGKHYAAICSNGPTSWFAVVDGKKGQDYASIVTDYACPPAFSPDSAKFAYVASAAGKYFLVVDDDESDAYDGLGVTFVFSPEGKHILSGGMRSGQPVVMYDGKPVASNREMTLQMSGAYAFARDGSHYAYRSSNQYGGEVFLDGKSTGYAGTAYALSPDGKHLAVAGTKIGGNERGLMVDGKFTKTGDNPPIMLTFTDDSQHLLYVCRERNPDPAATAVDLWEFQTYLDGKPVARCNAAKDFFVPMGYHQYTVHPGWQVLPDGRFAEVGIVGDSLKKFTITPGADTSLATIAAK